MGFLVDFWWVFWLIFLMGFWLIFLMGFWLIFDGFFWLIFQIDWAYKCLVEREMKKRPHRNRTNSNLAIDAYVMRRKSPWPFSAGRSPRTSIMLQYYTGSPLPDSNMSGPDIFTGGMHLPESFSISTLFSSHRLVHFTFQSRAFASLTPRLMNEFVCVCVSGEGTGCMAAIKSTDMYLCTAEQAELHACTWAVSKEEETKMNWPLDISVMVN